MSYRYAWVVIGNGSFIRVVREWIRPVMSHFNAYANALNSEDFPIEFRPWSGHIEPSPWPALRKRSRS